MLFDEFPHNAVLVKPGMRVSDGGGGYLEAPSQQILIRCFVDTPNAMQRYNAMKLEQSLDRYLFVPYGVQIDTTNDLLRYDNELYEFTGQLEDQGGMHEVVKVGLKWRE